MVKNTVLIHPTFALCELMITYVDISKVLLHTVIIFPRKARKLEDHAVLSYERSALHNKCVQVCNAENVALNV